MSVALVTPKEGDVRGDALGGAQIFTAGKWVDTHSERGQRAQAANDVTAFMPFVDLSSWVGREPPDRDFLVADLIPGGCVTSLYGDGGSGKTLIALWLMVAMASRYTALWLGERALGFRSVGLFAEDDEDELVRRLHRICEGLQVDFAKVAPAISALPGVGMDTIVAGFSPETGEVVITPIMDALLAKVRAEKASLLVLDYAAAIFAGNEIDRSQVSAFMRRLNAIAKDEDISILLLGHPSVEGMKGGRGTSGSTAWRNQARSFLHLTVDEIQNDPDNRRLLTLTHTKSNYSRSGKAFRLASNGSAFEILEAVEETNATPTIRLSPAQKVALRALQRAVGDAGCASPGGQVPIGVQCVQTNLWREYAYSMGISQSGTPEARKKAFGRSVQELVGKGVVGVCEPLAWAYPEAGQ